MAVKYKIFKKENQYKKKIQSFAWLEIFITDLKYIQRRRKMLIDSNFVKKIGQALFAYFLSTELNVFFPSFFDLVLEKDKRGYVHKDFEMLL